MREGGGLGGQPAPSEASASEMESETDPKSALKENSLHRDHKLNEINPSGPSGDEAWKAFSSPKKSLCRELLKAASGREKNSFAKHRSYWLFCISLLSAFTHTHTHIHTYTVIARDSLWRSLLLLLPPPSPRKRLHISCEMEWLKRWWKENFVWLGMKKTMKPRARFFFLWAATGIKRKKLGVVVQKNGMKWST